MTRVEANTKRGSQRERGQTHLETVTWNIASRPAILSPCRRNSELITSPSQPASPSLTSSDRRDSFVNARRILAVVALLLLLTYRSLVSPKLISDPDAFLIRSPRSSLQWTCADNPSSKPTLFPPLEPARPSGPAGPCRRERRPTSSCNFLPAAEGEEEAGVPCSFNPGGEGRRDGAFLRYEPPEEALMGSRSEGK